MLCYTHSAPLERKVGHLTGGEDPAPTGKLLDFQYLDSVDIWVSRYESRRTSYLPVFDWSGGSGKMLDLRVCVQVTAYGVCLLLYNPSLFPFGLGGGACMLVVFVDIVLPWRGEDIEDLCRALHHNA